MGATETALAKLTAEYPVEAIPSDVLHHAVRCVINFLGVAIYASKDPSFAIMTGLLKEEGAREAATVVGTGLRTSPQNAALANGYLGHFEDYDDSHEGSGIHPTSPILPAALAVGEDLGVSGLDVLAAFVLGVEVACRVGKVVQSHGREVTPWWHITETCGVFGAVAAAGRLLGLDADRMVHAFGIAGTQASGLRELSGSMCKPLHAGKAAQNGLFAAAAAGRGFTATDGIFEAPRGFLAVMASGYDLAEVTRGLGETWELPKNGLKAYSCGIVNHGLIDACLALRTREGVRPESVERIDARIPRLSASLIRRRHPLSGLDGKFCYPHSMAVALVDGRAYPAQYTDERVKDPVIAGLRDRIEIAAEPSLGGHTAVRVTLTLKDGRSYTEQVAHATGTPENPMSDARVEEKFRVLAGEVLPAGHLDRALDLLWRFDEVSDVRQVFPWLQRPPS